MCQSSYSKKLNSIWAHCLTGSLTNISTLEIGYRFDSFASAISFMMQIAIIADKMNHHPEWSNVYNRVHISLTTHDAGGVSMLDIELAKAMDKAARTRQAGIL